MVYAVKICGRWYIARITTAKAYGEPRVRGGLGISADTEVWSEDVTTAYLGVVGKEEKRIDLESAGEGK